MYLCNAISCLIDCQLRTIQKKVSRVLSGYISFLQLFSTSLRHTAEEGTVQSYELGFIPSKMAGTTKENFLQIKPDIWWYWLFLIRTSDTEFCYFLRIRNNKELKQLYPKSIVCNTSINIKKAIPTILFCKIINPLKSWSIKSYCYNVSWKPVRPTNAMLVTVLLVLRTELVRFIPKKQQKSETTAMCVFIIILKLLFLYFSMFLLLFGVVCIWIGYNSAMWKSGPGKRKDLTTSVAALEQWSIGKDQTRAE